MMTADGRETYPAAGVMVARPATAPVSSPTNFGLRCRLHSMASHVMAANDAATPVLRKARPVTAFTSSALPAWKPYHPNQRKPVPIAIRGILFDGASLSPLWTTYSPE